MSNIRYVISQDKFEHIPSNLFAYWVSESVYSVFEDNATVADVGDAKQGLITGNNDRFLRKWYEIEKKDFSVYNGTKWFPYNKGGEFRKWYGNNDLVVDWAKDGYEIRNYKDEKGKLLSRPQNVQYYKLQSITWTALTSGMFNARYSPDGFMFDAKGSSCFLFDNNKYFFLIAYFNSKVCDMLLSIMAPTLDYNCGVVARVPYRDIENSVVEKNAIIAIEAAKKDWDSFETSWDFKKHPLV